MKDKFVVKVGDDTQSYEGTISLSCTHNAYQWMTFSLTRSELEKVYQEIGNYLQESDDSKRHLTQ